MRMSDRKGAMAWFAQNPVAANLLMLVLLLGGVIVGMRVRQEVFPDFELDMVAVQVPYPGASPTEVEQGIVLAVEEAVRGLDGVDRVTSSAQEGGARVYVSLDLDADAFKTLSDIKNQVDRITSLPKDSERPIVSLVTNRFEVISLVLHGEQDIRTLRLLAEDVREQLLADPGITNAEVVGVPAHETVVEVPRAKLREYGITLEEIAARIQASALELPGGSVKTDGGEVLIRTAERRFSSSEYGSIPVVTSPSGTEITLGQLAEISETFAETDESATYDGEPAVMVKVFRTGDQTPIEVADVVKGHVERLQRELPEGVGISVWTDWSEIYRDRIDLLVRNAQMGLVLVLVVLGMFLELRLAFWVTMGIPTSFLGALMLMPAMDVSINMISLFAFIVTLGMVVDDAIVVGENIHELRERGVPPMQAAIEGVKGVGVPVTFSILTTVAAFAPMLFVPGFSGKLYRVIPSIVIAVLLISLVESLFVLPAHLQALKDPKKTGIYAAIHRQQQRISRGLERFVRGLYAPVLHRSLRRRYLSLSIGLAILLSTVGWVAGGRIGFRFMPEIEGDIAACAVELPFGAALKDTQRYQERIYQAAVEVLEEHGEDGIVRGIFSQVGTPLPGDPGAANRQVVGGHIANVQVFFVATEQRTLSTLEFMARWREKVGRLAGVERLQFSMPLGPSPGAPIDVELHHDDMKVLELASAELAEELGDLAGVWDIDDGFQLGKPQLDLKLLPKAAVLGLTSGDIARQVRNAFYGAEALRQQIGRNEVRVLVRLPAEERRHVHAFESLLVRTPTGGEVPLREVAEILPGRSWPVINRSDGDRIVDVTADVRSGETDPATVLATVESQMMPPLLEKYPGLKYELGGAQREQAKAMGSLQVGGLIAMLAIYALLAIPFKSYSQPIIVMTAIPFGFVGAVIGHEILGFDLSMISVMGLVALAGVAVNDSLVLVDAANELRRDGMNAFEAIHAAAVRRFRPIMLTSLTTFFGLTPMIAETSTQARFLIPMAVSLGFGVLFATFIILLLVPSYYLILEDVLALFGRSDGSSPDAPSASQSLPIPDLAGDPAE
jgi:multidrug efflux pump subunit AcrB